MQTYQRNLRCDYILHVLKSLRLWRAFTSNIYSRSSTAFESWSTWAATTGVMMEMPLIFLELGFFLSLLSTRPAKDIENHINFQCSDPWFKIDTGHVSIYKSLRFFFLGNAYLFTTASTDKMKKKKKNLIHDI